MQATGSITQTTAVRYASFPYEGVVHTVEFHTADGQRYQFERTGEYVPSELADSFTVSYFSHYPKIALIDDEPRVSIFLFVAGIMSTLPLCIILAIGIIEHKADNSKENLPL